MYAHGRSNSKGVAILFKRGFNPSITKSVADPDGRFLILQIEVQGNILTLINVYAPTQSEGIEQANFIEQLNSNLENLEITEVYLGGDFNISIPHILPDATPISPPPDSHTRASNRATYLARIKALTCQYNISNAWTYKFPHSKTATFHRGNQASTLDYWFLPDHSLSSITDISISPHPLSDHSLLSVVLGIDLNTRGPGYISSALENTSSVPLNYCLKTLKHLFQITVFHQAISSRIGGLGRDVVPHLPSLSLRWN